MSLPHFAPGQTWTDQSARELNTLVDEVRRLGGLISTGGLNVPSGAKPRSFQFGALPHPLPKTVVIIRKPLAEHSTLSVREAGYAGLRPVPCTTDTSTPPVTTCHYQWYGEAFDVSPPLGKRCSQYVGDEYVQGSDDVPPKLDTKFHSCHFEHDAWVLDDAGAEVKPVFVYVKASIPANSPTAEFLMVQRVKRVPIGDPPTDIRWDDDGEPEAAEVWPEYKAAHYLPMVGVVPHVICEMKIQGGTKYVVQQNRMYLGQPLTSLPQSDCVVPLRP